MDGKKPTGEQIPLDSTTEYIIGGKTFIVESTFKDQGTETVGTLLLKLMRDDAESLKP